jgi:hypothetical protein
VVGIFVAAVLLFIGIPRLIRAFNTVSTEDAYVKWVFDVRRAGSAAK